jgi:hypothetical protein
MKKVLLVLFMVLFAATLWSESVTEAAKKEKARREALAKQGKKAKVLTNKDVSTLKSSLGIESTGPTSEPTSSDPIANETTAAIEQAADDANSGLEELKQKRDELTGKVQELSDSINQGANASNIGERYQQKRVTEEELKSVEDQIQAIEAKRKEAAEKAESEQKQEQPQPQSQPQNQN